MPQFLSFENAGWLSQIVLAIFLVAGGAGTFFGYHNGKRAGISERTKQTIEELESLTNTLVATVDELERQNARQKELIAIKDEQIAGYEKVFQAMKAEFETERRHLVGIIKRLESHSR